MTFVSNEKKCNSTLFVPQNQPEGDGSVPFSRFDAFDRIREEVKHGRPSLPVTRPDYDMFGDWSRSCGLLCGNRIHRLKNSLRDIPEVPA